MTEIIRFTGDTLRAFGREIAATCEVRNEVNRQRSPNQVVITMGQTKPHGVPYQPRRFPPGRWTINGAHAMKSDTGYWPVFIDTNAHQRVRVWDLDEEGNYYGPKMQWITGWGYGIHHARWRNAGQLAPSRTTLGCINILDPDDAEWLGDEVREAGKVTIDIPPWDLWT